LRGPLRGKRPKGRFDKKAGRCCMGGWGEGRDVGGVGLTPLELGAETAKGI